MARYTVTELIASIRRGMGGVTLTLWPDTAILRVLNEAVLSVAEGWRPPYLNTTDTINTVVDQLHYDLPADYLTMVVMVNKTTPKRMSPIDRLVYAAKNQGVVPPGPAIEWFEDGDNGGTQQIAIRLLPSAVEELEFIYVREPVESTIHLATGDEFIDLPRKYDKMVLRRGIELGLSYDYQVSESGQQGQIGQKDATEVGNVLPRPPQQRYPIRTPAGEATRRSRGR